MFMPSILKKGFIDNVFDDDFFMDFKNEKAIGKTDIKELKDNYLLEVELPGFAKEDIKAEVNNGYLVVTAEHNNNKEEKDEKGRYIRKERYSGQCMRSFYVGSELKEEDIKAKFENGILKLEVPKKEFEKKVEQKKYIQIEG